MKRLKIPKIRVPKFKKPSSREEWQQLEEKIANAIPYILIPVMIFPLIFWGGYMRWLGLLIDCAMLFSLYKAYYRDIPPVHIGMPVSPFWGRVPKYLPEGKHRVIPWNRIQKEELKVKTHTVKVEEEKDSKEKDGKKKEGIGYFTLDGAPIAAIVDIFYRIDKDNIYLYKEIEGTETAAIDGKVREYLYGMIGALETDEVIAHQGEIAKNVLEEIRLHPITSKGKLLDFYQKKLKLLEKDLARTESRTDKDEDEILEIKSKIDKLQVDTEDLKDKIDELCNEEIEKYKEELKLSLEDEKAKAERDKLEGREDLERETRIIELLKEIKRRNELEKEAAEKEVKQKIKKMEAEKTLSELEANFAIRILGSRIYGIDIADEDAKKGRSKRTSAKFERAAAFTEWGTSDAIMTSLKKKHPDLTDKEVLDAILINRGRLPKNISEDKKVIEIGGLKEAVVEVAKLFLNRPGERKGGE